MYYPSNLGNAMPNNSYRRRQFIKASGSAVVAGALAGCSSDGSNGGGGGTVGESGSDGPDQVTATLGSPYEPGHILVQAAEDLAERVESETDGGLTINVVPGGSYGGEEAHADNIFSESIQMASYGTTAWPRYVPQYFVFNVPFTLEDFEHLQRIMRSDAMSEGRELLREEANHRMIGGENPWIYRGKRHYTSNNAVTSPDDVSDHNLRLPQYDSWVAIWEEVGANPVAIALNELYSSLQTGTANASEGPAQQIDSQNLYEVQDYYSLTGHHITPGAIFVADGWYQGLDETYQEVIDDVGPTVHQEATEQARSNEEELINSLGENGMEIIRDVDQEAFFEAGSPAAEQQFGDRALSYEEIQNI